MPLSLPNGSRLVIATHNPGKVPEIAALLDGRFDLVSAGELGLPEPEETENSFVGNALLKARAAASLSGLIAIADDSGLAVDALQGLPGIYSARWAGPGKDFAHAMETVQYRLEEAGAEDFSAAFHCALAVAWPDGTGVVFEGKVEGALTFPGRGTNGFGYDPIFTPTGGEQTFGEMQPAAKDAKAFALLKAALLE
jgi:XTP/dITP diphosphohydrolase